MTGLLVGLGRTSRTPIWDGIAQGSLVTVYALRGSFRFRGTKPAGIPEGSGDVVRGGEEGHWGLLQAGRMTATCGSG